MHLPSLPATDSVRCNAMQCNVTYCRDGKIDLQHDASFPNHSCDLFHYLDGYFSVRQPVNQSLSSSLFSCGLATGWTNDIIIKNEATNYVFHI